MDPSDQAVALRLLDAQSKAQALFAEIEDQRLIRAGCLESEINEGIYELANRLYGITRYWHKRIVRAGCNTLAPYDENPPDLRIADDDIVFLDLGPVFEDWEADFGRTFVVGQDPLKHKLCRDIEGAFAQGKRDCTATPSNWPRNPDGSTAAGSQDTLSGYFRTRKLPATKSPSMCIPKITIRWGCQTPRGEGGTGFSKFILWITREQLGDSTKSC
jgi:hypothetical protein